MESVAKLIGQLGAAGFDTRAHAVYALLQQAEVAFAALLKALRDETPRRRAGVAIVLGRIGNRQAVGPLIAAAVDECAEVRQWSAWALGELGDTSAVACLIECLSDDVAEVRAAAAHALGELGEASAADSLLGLLSDHDWIVQDWAAGALGKLGDPRAAEPVREILGASGPEPSPRSVVLRSALCRLEPSEAERKEHARRLTGIVQGQEYLAELAMVALRDLGPKAEDVLAEALAETPASSGSGMSLLMLALALSVSERYRSCATRVILDLLHDHRAPIEAAIDDAHRDRLFRRLASLAALWDHMQAAVAPGVYEAERWDLTAVVDQVIRDGYLQGTEPTLTLTALRLVDLANQLQRIPKETLERLRSHSDPEVARLANDGLALTSRPAG